VTEDVPRGHRRHQQRAKARARQSRCSAILAGCGDAEYSVVLSAGTIGELRQGVETVRHRGDVVQATRLARWLGTITRDYADAILPFDEEIAQIWGKLRVPHAENPLDKQIAATALMYGLTMVTRNVPHYEPTGVVVLNPFT
jgi:predicted nucleic acid-binding protein